jgi:hypothetical protein
MPDEVLYDYVLELWRKSPGAVLGRVGITVDWVPVREALILDLLRAAKIAQPAGLPSITVEPIWEQRTGGPATLGFRASLHGGGARASRTFSTAYFRSLAQQAAKQFLQAGELREGEEFDYYVLAFPRQPAAKAAPLFSATPKELSLPIKPANLERLMSGALLLDTENARDIPVFFHWPVLEDALVLTRQAGSMETGGVLIGHICQDLSVPEIFLEITAMIPARARGELTKLSFTPDTWADVQAAVERRQRDEIWLGWFHSHSFYREEQERREKQDSHDPLVRRIATPFLSDDDCKLHRVCFPRAVSVALLVTDSPYSGLSWTTFGWRNGEVAHRAFHVLGLPLPAGIQPQGEVDESKRECVAK